MEKFRKLGIKDEVLRVLHEMKFENPTEIQEKTIPLVLDGKDVIAGAATGSGKTLAFGSAIIQNIKSEERNIKALILTPTRELAQQVEESIREFGKYKGTKICSVYGGVGLGGQVEDIANSNVVVGTPGRILDHLRRGSLDLREVKILVLDEADRMLDMGFIDDVETIINKCGKFRQTLLFSATMPKEIRHIANRHMNEPVEIFAEVYVDPSKLKQVYYDVSSNEKFSLLVHLLKNDKSGLVMVFCNTQRNTDFVANNLKHAGIRAQAIHGGHSQNKRDKTMEQFHEKDVDVLVCTDVAARGLDIKGVSHVYNYDSPNETSQYVHRIGRTARAGAEGKAVNIISDRDYDNFIRIKREHPEIERQEIPEFERAQIRFKHEAGRGRFGGRSFGRESRFGNRRNFRGGSRNFGHSGNRGDRRDNRDNRNFRHNDSRRSSHGRFSRRDSRRERFAQHSRF